MLRLFLFWPVTNGQSAQKLHCYFFQSGRPAVRNETMHMTETDGRRGSQGTAVRSAAAIRLVISDGRLESLEKSAPYHIELLAGRWWWVGGWVGGARGWLLFPSRGGNPTGWGLKVVDQRGVAAAAARAQGGRTGGSVRTDGRMVGRTNESATNSAGPCVMLVSPF